MGGEMVKVRIAVAVLPDGSWSAHGGSYHKRLTQEQADAILVRHFFGGQRITHYVEVEVPFCVEAAAPLTAPVVLKCEVKS